MAIIGFEEEPGGEDPMPELSGPRPAPGPSRPAQGELAVLLAGLRANLGLLEQAGVPASSRAKLEEALSEIEAFLASGGSR
jgi:hypothetical protein